MRLSISKRAFIASRLFACGIIILAGSSALAQPSRSIVSMCDFCVASQGVSPIESSRSSVRYDLRYLKLGHLFADGERSESVETETHLTNQFTFTYQANDQFAASIILPYVFRTETSAEEDAITDNIGLSDIVLIGRYALLHNMQDNAMQLVSLNAGVKLPTGSTDAIDHEGELLDAHMQLGSGSMDLLLGSSVFVGEEGWAMSANLTGVIAGNGANDHRFGNSLNYDATYRYGFLVPEAGTRLYGTAGFSGEWRGKEREDAELVEDSGGNVTYIGPGVQIFLPSGISIESSFEWAVIHQLAGTQLGEDFRVRAGLQYGL